MPSPLPHVLVAATTTLAVWLLSDDGWPGLVIGGLAAFALWLMLRLRPVREGEDPAVPATAYLAAAVAGTALGYLGYLLGDRNGAWWPVGFILAGLVLPAASRVRQRADAS